MTTTTIFEHYHAFYNMLLSTTMMTNAYTPQFRTDAERIVTFIGEAYSLDAETIDYLKQTALDNLPVMGLLSDLEATHSQRGYEFAQTDEDILLDIKGDVLARLSSLHRNREGFGVNPNWFDYSHYKTYQPNIRYHKINKTAATGAIDAVRQIGILKMLGIGCKQDPREAIWRFTQCALWGDIPAMHYLTRAYQSIGEDQKQSVFRQLTELSETYLHSGRTVLSDDVRSVYDPRACTYYVYVSSILQDIVYAYNLPNIVFSFVEAFLTPSLGYEDKMRLIDHFEQKEWKTITNSCNRPTVKIGF